MTVEITLNRAKLKQGEDLIILVKREDQSDNQFSLTIHDQEGDSIYALGISGNKQTDTIVIPSEDIINWGKGEYSVRIFGVKNSLVFELVD